MKYSAGALAFVVLSVGVASSLSLIGGIGIEVVQAKLIAIVPLLIALPGLNSMVGDYATLIAAHAGDPAERDRPRRDLVKAMLPSIGLNTTFILLMSLLLAMQRDYALQGVFIAKFGLFVVGSIISVIAVMFLITLVLDKILLSRRLNPDDVLIPIVTTISDIFMLGLIALSVVTIF